MSLAEARRRVRLAHGGGWHTETAVYKLVEYKKADGAPAARGEGDQ